MWNAQPHPQLVRAVRPIIRALSAMHLARVEGADNIPKGPAILVGNHGVLGYESPIFFERVLEVCGRLPVGLADRWFFRVPVLRDLLVRLGGAYGDMNNGLSEFSRGNLVVVYPGGVREVLKETRDKYRLLWERSLGFAIMALRARVPIVPFAAAGVDDTFEIVRKLEGSGDLLMGDQKYDLPILGSTLPKPVPLWFRFGNPIAVNDDASNARDPEHIRELHQRVWTDTQALVDGLVSDWKQVA